MQLDRKAIRALSMLGLRGSFATTLADRAKERDNLAVLTADVGTPSSFGKMMKECPQSFYNIGIAEQNMIGIAAGMAKTGLNVFAVTFATFMAMRCLEQVRVNLAYMKLPIKIVGARAGIANGISGVTHYSLEDIAIMRALPNMTIVSPADALEAVKVADAALDFDRPMYIRLTGGLNTPIVYKEDYDFKIGKAIELREGKDVAIFVTGSITANALKAATLLEQSGIDAAVINMHTIKPLDFEIVDKYLDCVKLIVTVEEHSTVGGLGGAIAEYKTTKSIAPRQLFIGLPDAYGKAGEYDFLLDKYGLTADKLSARIVEFLGG